MRRAEADLLAQLKARLLEVNDLAGAAAVLRWDQATYMPPGGAEARGGRRPRWAGSPTRSTDAALGRLLDELTRYAETCRPTATRPRWCA